MLPFQAIILGAVQGLTELFPVSSLGHSVLLPHLLGWAINEQGNSFLGFLVATHLATALVLFAFFWREWYEIIKGIFRSLRDREISPDDRYAKLGWLLVVATIPVGIIGILFQDDLQSLFGSAVIVSLFLMLNGLMLLGIEYVQKKVSKRVSHGDPVSELQKLTWWQATKVGASECLALLPGFSRTGATLGGGLLVGLDHESAAKFSFLLATPVIFAAGILKVPELFISSTGSQALIVGMGAVCAAVASYLSVRFLSNYFKSQTMTPFGIYCLVAGAACLIYFVR